MKSINSIVPVRMKYEICKKDTVDVCRYLDQGCICKAYDATKYFYDQEREEKSINCLGYGEFEYLEYEDAKFYIGDNVNFSGGFSCGSGIISLIYKVDGVTKVGIGGTIYNLNSIKKFELIGISY